MLNLCISYVFDMFFCSASNYGNESPLKDKTLNHSISLDELIKNFTKDLHLISLHLYTRQQQEIDFPTLIFQYCDFFPSTLCIDILTCIILNKHLFQG